MLLDINAIYFNRHASFYVVDSKDILQSFKLRPEDLPVVYMVSSEQHQGEGFTKYTGEILELNLADWVLRNSAPPMGELTVATSAGIECPWTVFSAPTVTDIECK